MHWSSCHDTDLKDRTLGNPWQAGSSWHLRSPGHSEYSPSLALRGLRPVLGWDELPAACFGVIYRAAIYNASISAAVWGLSEEARGEGSSLPPPRAQPLREGMQSTASGPAWLGVEPGLAQGLVLLQPLGHTLAKKLCVELPGFFGVGFVCFRRK